MPSHTYGRRPSGRVTHKPKCSPPSSTAVCSPSAGHVVLRQQKPAAGEGYFRSACDQGLDHESDAGSAAYLCAPHLLRQALGVVHGSGAANKLPAVPRQLLLESRVRLGRLIRLFQLPERTPMRSSICSCHNMEAVWRGEKEESPRFPCERTLRRQSAAYTRH